MIGSKLVEKWEELGLCEPKSLIGSDLDWLFIGPENEAVHNFFSWFCGNISSSDVLTPEELQQYKELKDSGQILEGPQLDAMSAYLGGLGSLVPAGTNPLLGAGDLATVVPELEDHSNQKEQVQEQLRKLDQQLLRLNSRRDQLSMQELSMGAEMDELQTMLDSEQRSMTEQQTSALGVAQELTDYLAKLSAGTQQLTDVLLSLTQQSVAGQTLLVCSDFKTWQREEQRCSEALESLATKLFSLDRAMLATSCDLTLSSEDGSSLASLVSLEQSLAARQTPEEHGHLTAELRRLHQLVQSSSKSSAAAEVLAARHKAELEEAGHALERVNRGHYSSATEHSLREEEENVRNVLAAVHGEVEQQQAVVDALVERCAARPSTATLTADCVAKQLHQLYYSRQQHKVVSLELEQLARHDLVSIMVQCEAEAVHQTLQLLQASSSQLALQYHTALLRSAKLRQLKMCVDEDVAVGTMPGPLQALVAMVGEHERDEGVSKLSSALAKLSTVGTDGEKRPNRRDTTQVGAVCGALEQLLQQLQEAGQTQGTSGHSHTLHKLWSKCGLLEECLGGSGGRLPGSLPGSWLPASLTATHADLETRAYQLKHDMMAFLKQYEHKKKILSAQPELEDQLSSWTRPGVSE